VNALRAGAVRAAAQRILRRPVAAFRDPGHGLRAVAKPEAERDLVQSKKPRVGGIQPEEVLQDAIDIYNKVPHGKGLGAHVLTGPIHGEGAWASHSPL
jgi:hypothetical protein